MKIAIKIIKIAVILIFMVSVILFTASKLMQDKVAAVILRSLNHNISTKLHIGGFRLSFLSKFPHASLELRDVFVNSSPGFNSAAFGKIKTDTLLAAKNVSVEFKLTDILRGNYDIKRIRAKTGKVNLFTDTEGMVNYEITVKNEKSESRDFTINLENIYLSDIKSYYNNLSTKLIIYGTINRGTLKSRIHRENISFSAGGKIRIDSLRLYNTTLDKPIITDVDIDLEKTKRGIEFRKSNLHIDNYDLDVGGIIFSDNIYDLRITGKNIDIGKIRRLLPDKYLKMISEYDPRGILIIDSSIKGRMSRTVNPHTEVNFLLEKGSIRYGKSKLTVNDLSFKGVYSNGPKNRPETGSLKITGFKARLGSAQYTGSFSLTGFTDPEAELELKGTIFPGELREFFDLSNISESKGNIGFDLKFSGKPDFKKKFGFSEITDMDITGDMIFNDFSIGLNENKKLVNNVSGNVQFGKSINARNLKFLYKGQRIAVDGEFRNLLQWLDGRHIQMGARADVSFNRLIPEAFMADPAPGKRSAVRKTAFSLPDDLALDINFKIDSLTYKTFSSSKISGNLNYSSRLLTFKSFNMKALKGTISGNGFILQNNNKSVLSKGIFNVANVDVNRAFTSFRNFGQNFLKAENIAGSLSGSFSLLLPLDSMLNPQISSLTAEGKYLLADGGLINFEPVKQLSSFIELSELENIHFEQMQNDFFIRSNYLYIPQMQVRSSAVDLSVNGKHSFDNDYEYHVQVLLSEILSKKRKRNKNTVTEFGEVQDDGLGRTSMLLKIVGKGENIKVSYDMKAAAKEVKENFNSERKSLRNILNQEYGWFKKDSAGTQKPDEKKHRFKVTWDDK